MQVRYNGTTYHFENIPLKDSRGRPYDQYGELEPVIPLLKEKMKVIQSVE
jgi:hypothetical protein